MRVADCDLVGFTGQLLEYRHGTNTAMMTPMTRDQALRLLGLDDTSTWADIRHAYRIAIRRDHPDVGGSSERAAALNDAMAVLAKNASTAGTPPQSVADVAVRATDGPSDDELVFVAPAAEVFDRLWRALDVIADVVVADPVAGLLVGDLHSELGAGRLVVELRAAHDEALSNTVEFSLDQNGPRAAPPIDEVVRELARLVRSS